MPLLKASKKALRTSRRAQKRNALQARRLKESLKNADEKGINKTYSAIDKAAKRGIIHKNKAARLKSKIAHRIDKSKMVSRDTKGISR